MRKLFITITFSFSAFTCSVITGVALAAEKSGNIPQTSLLTTKPHDAVVNQVTRLTPINGHHFNLKAPQKCGDTGLIKKSPQEIQCQFSKAGEEKIQVYICDDAQTFCKPEVYKIKVTDTRGLADSKVTEKKQTIFYAPKSERPAPNGFIQNDPAVAQQVAKEQKKLLFIDFYATWCPPCNMLDEFVFSDKNFAQDAKEFVLARLDVDSDISWKWKEHFKVGGYPTIIVATPDLQEIGRIVGYRPKTALVSWLNRQQELKEEPVIAAQLRVGLWRFERGEYEAALPYFKELPQKEAQKYRMLSYYKIAEKKKDNAGINKNLTQLIRTYPNDIALSDWMLTLSEINETAALKLLPVLDKNLAYWKNNKDISEQESSLGDLYQMQALTYENLKKAAHAQARFMDCANYYAELSKLSQLQVARGSNLEQAYCLLKGGKPAEAKNLYSKMAEKYKEEFAFNYNYARALKELNELQEAYKYALLAYNNAYGDNFLRATMLKAHIEIALNQKESAKKTIQGTLNKMHLPDSKQLRSHRYMSELKTMLLKM